MDGIDIRGAGEPGIHLRDTVTVAIEHDDCNLAVRVVPSQTLDQRRVVIDAVVDEHDFAPHAGFIIVRCKYGAEAIETERRRHRGIIEAG